MIPIDRVRELLAAATPGAWEACGVSIVVGAASVGRGYRSDDAAMIAAAPDLARDVLSLADALATAERRAEAAEAKLRALDSIMGESADSLWAFALRLWRALGESGDLAASGAQVVDRIATVVAARDTARSALDGLTTAVRAEREARTAVVERVARCEVVRDSHECVSGMAHDRLCEARARHDKAAAHLDALLSAAPAPTTVPATLVRAYLAAEETLALVVADDHTRDTYHEWAARHGAAMDAVDTARTALDAALARCL